MGVILGTLSYAIFSQNSCLVHCAGEMGATALSKKTTHLLLKKSKMPVVLFCYLLQKTEGVCWERRTAWRKKLILQCQQLPQKFCMMLIMSFNPDFSQVVTGNRFLILWPQALGYDLHEPCLFTAATDVSQGCSLNRILNQVLGASADTPAWVAVFSLGFLYTRSPRISWVNTCSFTSQAFWENNYWLENSTGIEKIFFFFSVVLWALSYKHWPEGQNEAWKSCFSMV